MSSMYKVLHLLQDLPQKRNIRERQTLDHRQHVRSQHLMYVAPPIIIVHLLHLLLGITS